MRRRWLAAVAGAETARHHGTWRPTCLNGVIGTILRVMVNHDDHAGASFATQRNAMPAVSHGITTFTARMHTAPSPACSHENSREGVLTPIGRARLPTRNYMARSSRTGSRSTGLFGMKLDRSNASAWWRLRSSAESLLSTRIHTTGNRNHYRRPSRRSTESMSTSGSERATALGFATIRSQDSRLHRQAGLLSPRLSNHPVRLRRHLQPSHHLRRLSRRCRRRRCRRRRRRCLHRR